MNGSVEFGKDKIANAKIKFTQSGFNDDNTSLVMQIGFEIANKETVITNKFIFDTERIKELLNVLELRSFEELPRKLARVCIRNGKVLKIGNIIEDKWFNI